MNIRIKRAMVAAGVTTLMALPMSTLASDGTITFTGAVTASTCTVSVNGSGASATVTLPTVSAAALAGGAGQTTAAGTFFNVALSGCTAGPPNNVGIYFEAGPNVDATTYGLINTAVGSNVEVNLYLASGATVVGTQITPGSATTQPTPVLISGLPTGGTQSFYAGYSTAAHGAATAGAVSTSVTYSLVYN